MKYWIARDKTNYETPCWFYKEKPIFIPKEEESDEGKYEEDTVLFEIDADIFHSIFPDIKICEGECKLVVFAARVIDEKNTVG